MAKSVLLADPIFREHLAGTDQPERPERFDAVMEGLRSAGLLERLGRVESRPATEDELALCHTREYLRTAKRDVEAGHPYLSTGDTDITPNSWDVASRAAGGVLNAVDAVLTGAARNAFCAVRPPGHHATRSRGMGFRHLDQAARRLSACDFDRLIVEYSGQRIVQVVVDGLRPLRYLLKCL